MRHPDELELALYAASDLRWWRGFVVSRHLRGCTECTREVAAVRQSREFLGEVAGEMPDDLHWSRTSAEIRANIKLGLEAGAIAGPVSGFHAPARPMGWRIAAAVASLTVLTISGLWLHLPRPLALAPDRLALAPDRLALAPARNAQIVLKSGRSGIELAGNGGSLSLLHLTSERVTYTVGMKGELRARYVDDETGEVTIHHVYSE